MTSMEIDSPQSASRRAPALIINGDDFGLSPAVNRAIIRAHREGVLTSASLMINEDAADEAIEMARAHPKLAVGLHLTLVCGRAALPREKIPHLANEDGRFSESAFRAGINYYFHPRARRELRLEMRAQFEKFGATGLPFSHVDGHQHLHMHPVIFAELARLCEEYGVRGVRMVRVERPQHSLPSRILKDGGRRIGRQMLGLIFERLARSAMRHLAARDLRWPERVYGLIRTGEIDEEYLVALVEEMERVSAEIYLHPLAEDAEEIERRDNPGGAKELAALLSPRLRRAIEERGFRLANYGSL